MLGTAAVRGTVRLRPVPDAPPRALGLVRVSKARDDMISPELQRTAIEDHAARRGFRVVAWMEGLDESASRERSPWWRRLDEAVGLVEAGQVDVVLVWKVSRAARHRRRWAVALDRIEVAGGSLESATEGLDATTSTGRLARGMLAELAAWEADVKSEQWKETHARRLRMGLPHSGGARFGYAYRKGVGYTPDPDVAPLLLDLYSRYVSGEGFQGLAVGLNRSGVPGPRGGRWTAATTRRLLDSGFGAGLLSVHDPGCGCGRPSSACPRRVHLPGAHEAVVPAALWKSYLGRRASMARMPPRSRRPTYPLTGLVRHRDCGLALVPVSMRDHRGVLRRGYMYRCSGLADGRCRGIWVTRGRVEAEVLEQIGAWAVDVDASAATKTARVAARAVARADRSRLSREQARVEAALSRLVVDAAKDPDMPTSVWASAREALLAERAAVEERLAQVVEDERGLGADVSALRGLVRDWPTLAPADRREVLARFARRVDVWREGREVRVRVVALGDE